MFVFVVYFLNKVTSKCIQNSDSVGLWDRKSPEQFSDFKEHYQIKAKRTNDKASQLIRAASSKMNKWTILLQHNENRNKFFI